MADTPARTTSFAKSLDPEPPQQSALPAFNRHAAGLEPEPPPQAQIDRNADAAQMVQKDRPVPALTPDAMTRQQPDRQSYNVRLEQERQRLMDRNMAAVQRAKGSIDKDRDREL
jgi:hypothetical protein